MKTVIQNQRRERDEFLSRSYLPRQTKYDFAAMLASPMI